MSVTWSLTGELEVETLREPQNLLVPEARALGILFPFSALFLPPAVAVPPQEALIWGSIFLAQCTG